jgi:hypothetical protein
VASCGAEMSFGSAGTGDIDVVLRCGEANGRDTPDLKLCKHTRQLSRILFGKAKAAKERT